MVSLLNHGRGTKRQKAVGSLPAEALALEHRSASVPRGVGGKAERKDETRDPPTLKFRRAGDRRWTRGGRKIIIVRSDEFGDKKYRMHPSVPFK